MLKNKLQHTLFFGEVTMKISRHTFDVLSGIFYLLSGVYANLYFFFWGGTIFALIYGVCAPLLGVVYIFNAFKKKRNVQGSK